MHRASKLGGYSCRLNLLNGLSSSSLPSSCSQIEPTTDQPNSEHLSIRHSAVSMLHDGMGWAQRKVLRTYLNGRWQRKRSKWCYKLELSLVRHVRLNGFSAVVVDRRIYSTPLPPNNFGFGHNKSYIMTKEALDTTSTFHQMCSEWFAVLEVRRGRQSPPPKTTINT